MIRLEQLHEWLEKANEKIQNNKEFLTQLDQAIGDGDHGINMSRGFKEAINKIRASTYHDIGSFFQDVSMVFIAKVGGASGPLYGTAFMKAAMALKGKSVLTIQELAFALKESVSGIKMRGNAQAGEKTMLDVWEPVVDYLASSGDSFSWQEVRRISLEQMEHTRQMEARKGRAAYLGSRSVGHLDPGSVSSAYLFEALAETMEGSEDT